MSAKFKVVLEFKEGLYTVRETVNTLWVKPGDRLCEQNVEVMLADAKKRNGSIVIKEAKK